MATAQVKWFDNRRGWGYLVDAGGREWFVHHRDLEGKGYRTLKAGETVEFEAVEDERGPHAAQVRRVGD